MKISYDRLWKLLIDKPMTKTDLRLATKISSATLAKLSKNSEVSMEVIVKICEVLDCGIDDVMEIKKEI